MPELAIHRRGFRSFVAETQHRVTAPEFAKPLRAVDAPEGTSVMLECHVTGVPSPTIVWRRDTTVITETSPDYLLTQSAGTCCLKIKRAGKEHAGQYSCSATNSGGEATTSATVNVVCELTGTLIQIAVVNYLQCRYLHKVQAQALKKNYISPAQFETRLRVDVTNVTNRYSSCVV
jgi:hypothetical protein